MKLRGLLAVLMVMGVTSVALLGNGCGSSSSSSTTSSQSGSVEAAQGSSSGTSTSTTKLAKTKFALHAGLAFGAFHRYIYKPLKSGAFSGGLFHHKIATLKAAVAATFIYHEVGLALEDARASKLLSKALSPLLALQSKLASLRTGFGHGAADTSAIESANTSAREVSAAGASAGQPVTDQATPSL